MQTAVKAREELFERNNREVRSFEEMIERLNRNFHNAILTKDRELSDFKQILELESNVCHTIINKQQNYLHSG